MSIDASWAQETIWIKVKNYQWPGNIRELKNAVEWILFHLKEGVITYPSYLSESSFDKNLGHVNLPDLSPLGYKEALECFEKDYIMKQVKKYRGKITSICHEKGFNKVTLLSKMRKYNINRLQFINDF
jgi:DNA-binding NtrC family response regulator